jgi:DNA repair protein RadC
MQGSESKEEDAKDVAQSLVHKLEREGADSLATVELLAVLVGSARALLSGAALESRVMDAPQPGVFLREASALDAPEIALLARRSATHLRREFDLSRAAAARLAAAFALGRRVEASVREPRRSLRSPALVHDLMVGELRGQERESFHALLLDGKHRLRRRQRISEGTLTTSLVHPREVFAPALREGAAALIVVHNHPSGDPEPSTEDLAVTRRLIEVGKLLGIPLLDHVVVADERYVSIRERMRFDTS